MSSKRDATRNQILDQLNKKNWLATDLAKTIGVRRDALGYHLTRLRKEGVIERGEDKLWRLCFELKKPVVKQTPPVKAKEQEPSIRLLILAAQDGLDLALKKLDALENTLMGETNAS